MRFWLFLSLLIYLSPCMAADEPAPPTNAQLLQIFFQNINNPLKGEPWCQMLCGEIKEGDDENDPKFLCKTLGEYVSVIALENIGTSRKNDYFFGPVIDSVCDAGLGDTDNPNYPKGWFCRISFIEGTRDESGATTVQMIVKPDLSGVVPGTITCF